MHYARHATRTEEMERLKREDIDEAKAREMGEKGGTRGKGPWQRDVEMKLSEAISIGVRSSGKAETREHRVKFYTEKLAEAKLQVKYYEAMLRLEEEQEGIPSRYNREEQGLEDEYRKLKLGERVGRVRQRVRQRTEAESSNSSEDEVDGEKTPDEVDEVDEWDTTLVVPRLEARADITVR